jgi:hypothetical protein
MRKIDLWLEMGIPILLLEFNCGFELVKGERFIQSEEKLEYCEFELGVGLYLILFLS